MRDDIINNPSTIWFEVSGHCMAPLIRNGDFVMARAVDELKIGDIVIISGPPQVVHRVVKVGKGDLVVTKGDTNARPDPPLTKGNIAGKVTAIIRKGSKPVSIDGRLWRIENYFMAGYSMAGFWLWDRASRHMWLATILRRFAAHLRRISASFIGILTRLIIIFTG